MSACARLVPVSEHVLVIGIDGVRWDTLLSESTPHLDSVAAQGFRAPVRVNDDGPTISGPAWATVLTGVLPSRHGIADNDFTGHRLAEHPDVLSLARSQRPGIATWAGAAWLPLVTAASGGPMLLGGGWSPGGEQAHTAEEWEVADSAVTAACVEFLRSHDGARGSLVFCYLGGVDEVGHVHGVGPLYRDFVRRSDARVGDLLAVLATRPSEERWTILAVTDHGHVDAGGHGGDTDEERTAWLVAAGSDVPLAPPAALEQADVAGHAWHVLGLTGPEGAIGTALGTR